MNQDYEPSIRRASQADTTAIKALYRQLSPDDSNLDRDIPAILSHPDYLCLIMETGGRAIGMGITCIRTTLSNGRHMVLDELIIDREFRRRGCGRRLVEHCIDLARAEGLDSVEVACSLQKTQLHRFYESAGFKHRFRLYSLLLRD